MLYYIIDNTCKCRVSIAAFLWLLSKIITGWIGDNYGLYVVYLPDVVKCAVNAYTHQGFSYKCFQCIC